MVSHVKLPAVLHIVFGSLGLLAGLIVLLVLGGLGMFAGMADHSGDAAMALPILGGIGAVRF
jgi:hypothetical protein